MNLRSRKGYNEVSCKSSYYVVNDEGFGSLSELG